MGRGNGPPRWGRPTGGPWMENLKFCCFLARLPHTGPHLIFSALLSADPHRPGASPLVLLRLLLPSQVQLFATARTTACQASLSFTISQGLLKLTSIESAMPPNHPIFCHPLLLPSIFPSIRVFSNEPAVRFIRWPKYWSFSFSISPSNEYSGLIMIAAQMIIIDNS